MNVWLKFWRTGAAIVIMLASGTALAQHRAGDALAAAKEQALPVEQFLYQYLLSEIAGQRGGASTAARGLIDLAARTRDAKVARRAVEIAYQANQLDEAREGATLWLEIEPASIMARQLLSRLAGGTLETSVANLRTWLAEPKRTGTVLMQVSAILARYPDKARMLDSVRDLTRPYLTRPEARYALAQAEVFANNIAAGLNEAEAALALRANWAPAAILKAQILREQKGSAGAEVARNYLQSFLAVHPAEPEVRLAYARLLVAEKSLLSAREEYRRVARETPDNAEVLYAIGLISQQIGDYADAEAQYQSVLSQMPSDPNPVWYNLGDVANLKKDPGGALNWYRKVNDGDYFIGAQLKIATILAKRDGIATGRKYLRDARNGETESTDTQIQLTLVEAQLLRDYKAFAEVFTLLSDALRTNPDHPDLLYERAMVAEKINKFDVLEADLKRVIEIKPSHAHAFNALGYTLADQGKRLNEAQGYIEKALKLAPNDAFIQDSLGWVQFRQGRKEEALNTLKKAYETRPDPEIAAHLGEVMWSLGQRKEAQDLWKAQLVEHPENESLLGIMKKYKP